MERKGALTVQFYDKGEDYLVIESFSHLVIEKPLPASGGSSLIK